MQSRWIKRCLLLKVNLQRSQLSHVLTKSRSTRRPNGEFKTAFPAENSIRSYNVHPSINFRSTNGCSSPTRSGFAAIVWVEITWHATVPPSFDAEPVPRSITRYFTPGSQVLVLLLHPLRKLHRYKLHICRLQQRRKVQRTLAVLLLVRWHQCRPTWRLGILESTSFCSRCCSRSRITGVGHTWHAAYWILGHKRT